MADRDAKSIDILQAQIKAAYPGRDTDSDGTIAGAAHHLANPTSDHEADSRGIVHAVDLTHDLSVGFDSYKWADYMAGLALGAPAPDSRIKYIISNSRIWNPSINAAKWRPYNGSNPHDHHVHVSINKVGEDDTRPWNIGPVPIASATPDAPRPPKLLKRGSKGEEVRELQRLLGISADGDFGPKTEASVKAFQASRGLVADGKVGPQTWQALLSNAPVVTPPTNTFLNIVASVFGGTGEVERSAYDNHRIGESEYAVALPARFKGERPKVAVTNPLNGKTVICTIEDVGPWNGITETKSDRYWETNGRPQAESGTDLNGRKTNKAGIDLSPAAARAIGINGMGRVNWNFDD